MEIIKQGKKIYTCIDCGVEFKLDDNEIINSCPCCHAPKSKIVEKVAEDFISTFDFDTAYPTYYSKINIKSGAVDLSNEEVQNLIRETVNRYKKYHEFVYTAIGNTWVMVYGIDDDNPDAFEVFVTKDYMTLSTDELY
jgi:DNA-directed RNA polymerase subunit RPC12/RpoP